MGACVSRRSGHSCCVLAQDDLFVKGALVSPDVISSMNVCLITLSLIVLANEQI